MSLSDIIAKVKDHPELWQTTHPFYRHRIVSARTWKQIAAELRADDWVNIKKRWKHMKDTFRKEIKKITTNQIAISSWIHYSELEFLAEEMTRKQMVPESDVSEIEAESKKKPKTKRLRRRRMESQAPVEQTSQFKFRRIIRSLNSLCKQIGKSSDFVDEELKNDTDYMFLVSLLPTMRNLTDIQRLQFRGNINNWLLNALMENEFSTVHTKHDLQSQIKDPYLIEGSILKDCKIKLEGNK